MVVCEMAQVKERNAALMSENESMRARISAQEDAIAVAQHLKEQTDRMIADYEQVKNDLGYQGKRTDELQKDLSVNVAGRRRAEEKLVTTRKDLEDLRVRDGQEQAKY